MVEAAETRTSIIMLLKSRDDDVHLEVVSRVRYFNNFLSCYELTLEFLPSFFVWDMLLCLVEFLSLCIWYTSLIFIFSDNFTHDEQWSFRGRFLIFLRSVICYTLSFRFRSGNFHTWTFRTLPWGVRLLFKSQWATWPRRLSFRFLSANRCGNHYTLFTLSIW